MPRDQFLIGINYKIAKGVDFNAYPDYDIPQITLQTGPIGYLTLDAQGNYKQSKISNRAYSTNTYDNFVNEVNLFHPHMIPDKIPSINNIQIKKEDSEDIKKQQIQG